MNWAVKGACELGCCPTSDARGSRTDLGPAWDARVVQKHERLRWRG